MKHCGSAQWRNDYSRQDSAGRSPFAPENRWLAEKTAAILFYFQPQIQDFAASAAPGMSLINARH
jgi:hypothetical protein